MTGRWRAVGREPAGRKPTRPSGMQSFLAGVGCGPHGDFYGPCTVFSFIIYIDFFRQFFGLVLAKFCLVFV
jgi:hypothetical protein